MALSAFSLTACIVAAEIALRIYVAARGWTPNCYAAQLALFRPHEANGYDLRPGFRLRSGRYVIGVNDLGLRGLEIAGEKKPGVKRIAIVGESAAFGYFVSDGQEAARLLESKLHAAGHAVQVINAGVPGYALRQVVRRYRETVAPLKPDVVVAYLGWNDLPSIVSATPDAARFERLPIAPTWERLLGRSTLYGFVAYRLRGPVRLAPAKLTDARAHVHGIERFRKDLADLADTVQISGAKLVVCTQAMAARPDVEPALRQSLGSTENVVAAVIELGGLLSAELEKFAKRRQLPFIDVRAEIAPTTENLGDYVHLTVIGEDRLATIWSTRLPTLW